MAKKPPNTESEKPEGASRRKRPPATIDLSATEVHVAPAESASDAASEPLSDEASTNVQTSAAPDSEAPVHETLPDVIEPVPQATFYEQPVEGETVESPHFRASREPPLEAEAEPVRSDPPPPPSSPRFPWAVASAAGAGGALVLFLALFFAGVLQTQKPADNSAGNTAANTQANASLITANAELSARLAKLESTLANIPAAPASDPALTARLSALETAVKSVSDSVSNTTSRGSEASDAAREARERSEANAKALAELKSSVDQLNGSAVAKSDLEKFNDRVSAVETSTRTVEQKIETPGSTAADRDVRIAVLASSLKATVERGSPFSTELNAIKPLVSDRKPVTALEPFAAGGVPSQAATIAEFASLMPALNVAAAPSTSSGGILDRLQASANRLVRVRPVNEAPGTDPASILDRAEAKSLRGDIAGVVNELSNLPANVRAPADVWIAKTNARTAALAAVQQISADALNALAKPAH